MAKKLLKIRKKKRLNNFSLFYFIFKTKLERNLKFFYPPIPKSLTNSAGNTLEKM